MNASYLKEADVQNLIRRTWAGSGRLPFFGRIRRCVKKYKEYCIRRAKEGKIEEQHWRQRLEQAVTQLHTSSTTSELQDELSRAASFLGEVEKRKVEGLRLRSRIKWKQHGDRGRSKEFFQAHRQRSSTAQITVLDDVDGVSHTDQPDLERICQAYYQKLYTDRVESEESREAEGIALRCIPDKLSNEMKSRLQAPLNLGELAAAVKDMQAGKAPGPDGIVLEFYSTFWDILGPEFLKMVHDSI